MTRNWPTGTLPENVKNDRRFDINSLPRRVQMPNGQQEPVSGTPHVYFFDGPRLMMFPVKMTKGDVIDLHGRFRELKNYRDLLPLLRKYEVPGK